MKTLKKLLLTLIFLLIAVTIIAYLNIGRLVTGAVNKIGPKATLSELHLDGFKLNIFTGEGKLTGFVLGNPEGYKTKSAFKVDDISIKLDPKSLFTDTIHIKEIIIKAPHVTLEKGLTGSNFEQIQKNIEEFSKKPDDAEDAEENDAEAKEDEEEKIATSENPAKKIVIDLIRIENGQVKLSIKGMQGIAAPIPLPLIELKDIGKDEDDPKNIIEIINMVIAEVLGASVGITTDIVKGVGGLGIDTMKGVAGLLTEAADTLTGDSEKDLDELSKQAEDVVEQVEEEAEKAIETLKSLFNKK